MFQISERQTQTEMHRSWVAFRQSHEMKPLIVEVKKTLLRVRFAFVEENTNQSTK